jgi:hypothetical protein
MHQLLRKHEIVGDAVFDPEAIAILSAAFYDAWKLIQESGATFASPAHAEEARVTIAKYIIEAAKLGERDQLRLRDDALAYYAKSIVRRATDHK